MNKNILSIALALIFSLSAGAQSEVHLLINHRLGANTYDANTTTSNNLGDQFNIKRLDYYLAEIVLYHDGGQVTPITDHYVLVKVGREGHVRLDSLGNHNITQLDSIRFGVGVDAGKNHSDISAYPSQHPLSFQSPSMHWGWSAGYRFVAIEGQTGSSMNLGWQIHGLGDNNYGYVTIPTAGSWSGSDLTIAIDGDYAEALRDIPVSGSLNYHGSSAQAVTLLSNFQNHVFSAGAGNVSLNQNSLAELKVYPNPSKGQVSIKSRGLGTNTILEVRDMQGRLVLSRPISKNGSTDLQIEAAGIYMVQLIEGSMPIAQERLVVK